MPQNPLDNPMLHAQVERALAPYKVLLPPEILEEFRVMLAIALATHPVTSSILERLGPEPVVDASTDVERFESEDVATPAGTPRTRAGGNQR